MPEGRGSCTPEHIAHTVTLNGKLISKLTQPVSIPWPGVTYDKAAQMLGREYPTILNWVRHGVFSVNRYPEFRFPRNNKLRRKAKQILEAKRRKAKPRDADDPPELFPGVQGDPSEGRAYIWTPLPIDPNSFCGRSPHAVWGTLWQHLWKDMPEDFELKVRREPVWRESNKRNGKFARMFRGWQFICPGRLNQQREFSSCGRRCTYLYAPQTVWTLAQAIAGATEVGFDMPPPEESGLAGQWHPGASDPVKDAAGGMRSFACKTCWGVRSACMANHHGWHDFISAISGGLLRGSDVPRPLEICPMKRKKRKYTRRRKPVAAREEDQLRIAN